MTETICKHCGKQLNNMRRDAIYCSIVCQRAARYLRDKACGKLRKSVKRPKPTEYKINVRINYDNSLDKHIYGIRFTSEDMNYLLAQSRRYKVSVADVIRAVISEWHKSEIELSKIPKLILEPEYQLLPVLRYDQMLPESNASYFRYLPDDDMWEEAVWNKGDEVALADDGNNHWIPAPNMAIYKDYEL